MTFYQALTLTGLLYLPLSIGLGRAQPLSPPHPSPDSRHSKTDSPKVDDTPKTYLFLSNLIRPAHGFGGSLQISRSSWIAIRYGVSSPSIEALSSQIEQKASSLTLRQIETYWEYVGFGRWSLGASLGRTKRVLDLYDTRTFATYRDQGWLETASFKAGWGYDWLIPFRMPIALRFGFKFYIPLIERSREHENSVFLGPPTDEFQAVINDRKRKMESAVFNEFITFLHLGLEF